MIARIFVRCVVAVVLALLACARPALAAGVLDPDFANGANDVGGLRGISIAIAPDGRIAVGGTILGGSFGNVSDGETAVFDPSGLELNIFGNAGCRAVNPIANDDTVGAMAYDPLGRLITAGSNIFTPNGLCLSRTLVDGTPSGSFAPTSTGFGDGNPIRSADAMAVDRQGRILIGGTDAMATHFMPQPGGDSIVSRVLANGGFDVSFGTQGSVQLPHAGFPLASLVRLVAEDAQGRILVGSQFVASCELRRLLASGVLDSTFGAAGVATTAACSAIQRDASDRILVIVGQTLSRFVDGNLDPSFGAGGVVMLQQTYSSLAVMSDNGPILAGAVFSPPQAEIQLLRLREDGTIDASYGTAGVANVSLNSNGISAYLPPVIAVDSHDRAIVAIIDLTPPTYGAISGSQLHLFAFTGRAAPGPAQGTAVEYYYAGFDHYFTTAVAAEIAALDAGVFPGWVRTGQMFQVYMRITAGLYPVCRFFSGAAFAPKSSHFYTHYPAECDFVATSPVWEFEGLVYDLRLPDNLGHGNGTCPTGTLPLYRLYNNGQGGAPNHRYTTSQAIFDQMIAGGWVFEGEAGTHVYACVPQ